MLTAMYASQFQFASPTFCADRSGRCGDMAFFDF